MKRTKLSKVLALLLACVMIFTTLPLMAFAQDEADPYIVSYGAPAIPMNTLTKVNLSDIYVEMDANGTTVPGSLVIWNAEKNDGFAYNAADNTITAFAKGT